MLPNVQPHSADKETKETEDTAQQYPSQGEAHCKTSIPKEYDYSVGDISQLLPWAVEAL